MGIRCIFSLRFAHTVGYLKLKSGEEIQKLAMRTHREVQQREDIRRDLAERMKFVPPDLRVGESGFHWQEDASKIQ